MGTQDIDEKNGSNRASYLDRRSFLRIAAAGSLLPFADVPSSRAEAVFSRLSTLPEAQKESLPAIPEPADLASDRLVHHFRDFFNPPEVQNELGALSAHKSVSAITAIALPPFACCCVPPPAGGGVPRGQCLITCELFLDGQILANYPSPVAYTWYPHKIVRESLVEGLQFTTETFLLPRKRVVAESIVVKNESSERRKLKLGFDIRAGVTVDRGIPGLTPQPAGGESDNRIIPNLEKGAIVFEARHSEAVSVQGIFPHPDRIEQQRMMVYEFALGPGEIRTLHYVNVIGDKVGTALDIYSYHQAHFDQSLEKTEENFVRLLHSAFTPGNPDFSGHLPQLRTSSPELWKLYYTGFANLLVSRRVNPDSVYGTTYITINRISPTQSFIWDTMLTSLSLSLLDPKPLRSLLEAWLGCDMDQHLAIDYITGAAIGPWYAVNDMGILRCAHSLLRVTGNFAWLDTNVKGKPVMEHLVDHALYWKSLVKTSTGFADYGAGQNLLEVVNTWTHEVPAMNAGNVYGMRFVATLLDRRGDTRRAANLRSEGKQLADRINQTLYVQGKGWWRCGQPDGTFNEVRHCFDLLTILDMMSEDLSASQKREMSRFFWDELHTPLWMHALSPGDADATWQSRADHSWVGAYGAWPPMMASGLYKIDSPSRVTAWVKGAKAANQGPFGQSHIVETVFPPEQGGAHKSSLDSTLHNHWVCISGGSFTDLVINSVFGANLTLHDGIQVDSRVADFDPRAELRNVSYQGQAHVIGKDGVQRT